jgi:hypothetical protein
MSDLLCTSCSTPLEADDNFCRQCGVAHHAAQLPAFRRSTSVTLWRPQTSPVVKGAAVMAVGTIGQFIVRRAIGGLLNGSTRPKRRPFLPSRRRNDGMVDEAQIITETVMMRRVRIRRPA